MISPPRCSPATRAGSRRASWRDRLPAAARFQVYRNNVFISPDTGARATCTRWSRGWSVRTFFNQVARRFIRPYPSRSGNLLDFGRELPAFLADCWTPRHCPISPTSPRSNGPTTRSSTLPTRRRSTSSGSRRCPEADLGRLRFWLASRHSARRLALSDRRDLGSEPGRRGLERGRSTSMPVPTHVLVARRDLDRFLVRLAPGELAFLAETPRRPAARRRLRCRDRRPTRHRSRRDGGSLRRRPYAHRIPSRLTDRSSTMLHTRKPRRSRPRRLPRPRLPRPGRRPRGAPVGRRRVLQVGPDEDPELGHDHPALHERVPRAVPLAGDGGVPRHRGRARPARCSSRSGSAVALAALALFVFNIVAVISYPELEGAGLEQHYVWGIMLLVTLLHGPGALSLDHLIARFVGRKPAARGSLAAV